MTINFLGITVHEFDVAITDLLLFSELLLFALILLRQRKTKPLINRISFYLFASLAWSSFFGVVFHAFFPTKAETIGGFVIWSLVAAGIGAAAVALWAFNIWIMKNKISYAAKIFLGGYSCLFAIIFLLIDYHFTTIIIFYLSPLVILGFISLWKLVKERDKKWLLLLAGIVLSLAAAVIQWLQIDIDPQYFNFNSLYHSVQAVAFACFFLAFRHGIIKRQV